MTPSVVFRRKRSLSMYPYLLGSEAEDALPPCRRYCMSLSGTKHTECLNAATFPIQMSCIGVSEGKGKALSNTHRRNAMQQPR